MELTYVLIRIIVIAIVIVIVTVGGYVSGVWTGTSDDIHDNIYKYEGGVWSPAGHMKTPRKYQIGRASCRERV